MERALTGGKRASGNQIIFEYQITWFASARSAANSIPPRALKTCAGGAYQATAGSTRKGAGCMESLALLGVWWPGRAARGCNPLRGAGGARFFKKR